MQSTKAIQIVGCHADHANADPAVDGRVELGVLLGPRQRRAPGDASDEAHQDDRQDPPLHASQNACSSTQMRYRTKPLCVKRREA